MGKVRIKKGFARVEFLSLKNRIDELLEEGYLVSNIYEILSNEGVINFSYARLTELIREFRGEGRTRVRRLRRTDTDSNPKRKSDTQEIPSFGKKDYDSDENI